MKPEGLRTCLRGAAVALAFLLSACSGSSHPSGSSCSDACPAAGATQCSGLQVQTCIADASGCLSWSAAADCSGSAPCDATRNACPERLVDLSWAPNRERGVNGAGGGYRVSISGRQDVVVPYVSGSSAPTSTSVLLPSGSYTVSVRAYAALDAQGGSSGTVSAPSQSLAVTVP